ncbi:Tripeptidyl-peptidase sed1 [Escovopsis weberi]|uniref:tripeptidyl-peptidase II n=1 Tax=Escovopsis weberi TaxID=150374 RepID=A0A0M9VRL6_ESCWE|nr:Tripeptidyl-peptidase sed1 [Escovopsis weberi]
MGLSQYLTYGVLTAAAVLASPCNNHVVHEKRDINTHWVKRDRLAANDVLPMRIGLAQRNLDKGHDLLMEISDPKSSKYGQHLTPKEVFEMFSPSKRTVDAVSDWLLKSGIPKRSIQPSTDRGWIHFNATTQQAEHLFQTRYHTYEHGVERRSTVGCDEYKVPLHVRDHIDFVEPGVALQGGKVSGGSSRTSLPEKRDKMTRDAPVQGSCFDLVTPDCIREMYNAPIADKASPGNELGVFEKGSWYSPLALDAFFGNYSTRIPKGTRPANVSIDLRNWHYDTLNPTEADMDVQLAFSLIYPQNLTVIQVDDDYYNGVGQAHHMGLFNTWLNAIDSSYCNFTSDGETGNNPDVDPVYPNPNPNIAPGIPITDGWFEGQPACGGYKRQNVISLSYGWTESTLPTNYQFRQCKEFMKLGLMGSTIMTASGDTGTADTSLCSAATIDFSITTAQYPANCPYVLAVGATQVNEDLSESGANAGYWATGGGFSYNYSRPAYQDAAVTEYNEKHNTLPKDKYNANGRAFPDVSAVGLNLAMIGGPIMKPVAGAGTSASTPILASLINMINEERIAAGKNVVGFVNPTFYQHPEIFHDIVAGNNSVCGSPPYNATEGWDPIGGLGTPDYQKMLKVFMDLP